MSTQVINERLSQILLKPLVSEKATHLGAKKNVVTFWVTPSATKKEIKAAVEKFFPEVKVTQVRTSVLPRRIVRFSNSVGREKRRKKAYVHLLKGTDINFEEMV